jgi:hypothetical protein
LTFASAIRAIEPHSLPAAQVVRPPVGVVLATPDRKTERIARTVLFRVGAMCLRRGLKWMANLSTGHTYWFVPSTPLAAREEGGYLELPGARNGSQAD